MRIEHWLYALPLRLRSLLRRSRVEQDLDDELRDHLERRTQEYLGRGLTPPLARQAALRSFGGVEQVREHCRDTRGVGAIETLVRDLRYGARTLRRAPGFTVVAVLTLALGIGANTAIFSLVSGILLAPLPFREPDALVSVTGTYPKGAFAAMRERIRTMDVAAHTEGQEVNLTGLGEPIRLTGARVSAELFAVLGVQAALGRTFTSGEDVAGRDRVVVLSYGIWEERFDRSAATVGRIIQLDGVDREVVGVMPPGFRFPSPRVQFWIPIRHEAGNPVASWGGEFMPVIGRLRPGETIESARADVRTFQSHVTELFPWKMPASWNADVSVVPLQHGMVAGVRGRLLILFAAVALVLLIACANVANLTLSRAASREREIAIRTALGAGRQRIARQLITESVLLALLGGMAGLVFAGGALSLLTIALPADTPRLLDVQMDWRVLLFTGALSILTGVMFGVAPALQIARAPLNDAFKTGGRGAALSVSQRLRSSLVVAEVALAVLLVVAAGLLIRSLWALSHANPGFRSDSVVTARITPSPGFCADAARCLSFYQRVVEEMQAAPGIEAAALINTPPLGGLVTKRSLDLQDFVVPPGETSPLFWLHVTSPDYFRVMGIPLVAGRSFTAADATGGPAVAIVTPATARRYWPGQNPLGKRIRFVGTQEWHTIVGIAGDIKAYDLQRSVPEWIAGTLYVPHGPRATTENGQVPVEMTITLRTGIDPVLVGRTLRETVGGLNREVPVSDVKPMTAVMSAAVSTPTSTTALFVAFAALALVLGMIGIYGVLSFLVSKRTREIGIRLALGANRRDVLRSVLGEGAKLAAIGISLGLGIAFVAARLLSNELYGVSSMDPATYLGVALTMGFVTLVAACIPTLRAMRVDPVVALRDE